MSAQKCAGSSFAWILLLQEGYSCFRSSNSTKTGNRMIRITHIYQPSLFRLAVSEFTSSDAFPFFPALAGDTCGDQSISSIFVLEISTFKSPSIEKYHPLGNERPRYVSENPFIPMPIFCHFSSTSSSPSD